MMTIKTTPLSIFGIIRQFLDVRYTALLWLTVLYVAAGSPVSAQFIKGDKIKAKPKINKNTMTKPVLEWQKFGEDKGSDGKTYKNIRFGITNWTSFPDQLFAAAPALPACGSNKSASRTWLDIFDAATDKRLYGFCAFNESKNMQSQSFNLPSRDLPKCIYVVLTDRQTKVNVKSNAIHITDGNNSLCENKQPIIK